MLRGGLPGPPGWPFGCLPGASRGLPGGLPEATNSVLVYTKRYFWKVDGFDASEIIAHKKNIPELMSHACLPVPIFVPLASKPLSLQIVEVYKAIQEPYKTNSSF